MSDFTVAIVGGGLVGSLSAVYFAKRGYRVKVYEKRPARIEISDNITADVDIRKETHVSGRSINLALSVRGLAALEGAGVSKTIAEILIPMRGRMVHDSKANLSAQLSCPKLTIKTADKSIICSINSVDRKLVNQELLNAAEKYPNVTLYFEHNIMSCDFDNHTLLIAGPLSRRSSVHADLIIGADGVYSRVRADLLHKKIGSYSQEYIDHGYVELTMPSTHSGNYAMDPGHLHIWPRQTFMMIALPNVDRSFTVTLFMPWSKFDEIKTKAQLVEFFEEKFADAVPLIGKEFLVQEYFKNVKGSLVSIKCKPYHYKSSGVIIGDAAHAMVPFYGQGMNCGFEDAQILDELFSKHLDVTQTVDKSGKAKTTDAKVSTGSRPTPGQLAAILDEYSTTRNPDAEAICDLALNNYIEMRSSVTRWSYLLRKKFEGVMCKVFPNLITPLYTMVAFSQLPYSEAMRRWKSQTRWYGCIACVGIWGGITGLGVYAFMRTPQARRAIISLLDY
ncbi:hypothetical protein BSLG_002907 [Batrachochytrium salamandrivorans]|nr:hypothetical protein BSLG_002907 [Batrachochytrium salamandrivorans]